jgi:hypothetical protein
MIRRACRSATDRGLIFRQNSRLDFIGEKLLPHRGRLFGTPQILFDASIDRLDELPSRSQQEQ